MTIRARPDQARFSHAPRPAREDRYERFARAYIKYATLVWGMLRFYRVPSAYLPDAAQDVLLTLYRRFDVFEASTDPSAWLRTAAFYVSRNHLRAIRRASFRGRVCSGFDPDELAAPQALSDELLASREQRAIFTRALASVHPTRREVLQLAEFDGLTARQIGARIGISPNTVASRLRRARKEFADAARRERDAAHPTTDLEAAKPNHSDQGR